MRVFLGYSICISVYFFWGALAIANGSPYVIPKVSPSQSDFGGVGLLQLPTARMANEGEFSINLRDNNQYNFYSISLQSFPWLETTLRYTDVTTRRYGVHAFSGDQSYKDKGIDIKVRLLEEHRWQPDLSFGARDLGGTGLFDSEYFAATKAIGPIDYTLGIGWGYMSSGGNIRNPICGISDNYCSRDPSFNGNGGSFDFQRFFNGPMGLFGGIEYQTFFSPLSVKLEYDSNDYRGDFAGSLPQQHPFNFGLRYRFSEWGDFTLGYERGNTVTFGLTARTNFDQLRRSSVYPKRPKYDPTPLDSMFLDSSVTAGQLRDLRDLAGFHDPMIKIQGSTLYASGRQADYSDRNEGVERANVIMMNNLPKNIGRIVITEQNQHMDLVSYVSQTSELDNYLNGVPLGHQLPNVAFRSEPRAIENPEQGAYIKPSRWSLDWSPELNQSFGGPESFYMYQIGIGAQFDYQLEPKWMLSTSGFVNIYNNYDRFNFTAPPPDSHIPQVRTHIRDYVQDRRLFLNSMQLNHTDNLAKGWYMQNYAGYLEMMFAGIGSEILYRPLDGYFAVGLDFNWVRQRDWNNTLGLIDYGVVTSHLTTYWQPFNSDYVLVKFGVGRYLAGDVGGSFDISRRFDSGIIAGAYATLTNVSSDDYGEGSFTKGFYVSIPFDLMTVNPTNTRGRINWTPLTRDGGQKLNKNSSLYDITEARGPVNRGQ